MPTLTKSFFNFLNKNLACNFIQEIESYSTYDENAPSISCVIERVQGRISPSRTKRLDSLLLNILFLLQAVVVVYTYTHILKVNGRNYSYLTMSKLFCFFIFRYLIYLY